LGEKERRGWREVEKGMWDGKLNPTWFLKVCPEAMVSKHYLNEFKPC